ncbi:Fic family protein [Anaerococcus murdochii]|uniref:Fic family protein n=1 Tax=Anaerococcus murdochii TaxID=411577 RepID=A0ABS7T0L0_9FIRM|nr:Fic family protein [Anaerococcus murdochii]MBZ2387327.1 Fic family protein [Anaerococcus murdochii]
MTHYDEIKQLNDFVKENIDKLPKETYQSIVDDFDLRFTHESTKIEGNTLSIAEVKTLLVDKVSIGGKDLRELYEVTNNEKAFRLIKSRLEEGAALDEELIKDIHQVVMENILEGGLYRNYNVRITGAGFTPPDWTEVRNAMKWFMADFESKKSDLNAIELASYVHAEFVRIHPFQDGNGRTARLLLNFMLMKAGYQPVIIEAKDRPIYYESLNDYAAAGNLENFYSFILNKEKFILEDLKSEIYKVKNRGKSR